MKNWYNTLSQRERNLVVYGGITAILILLWMFAVKPLVTNHKKYGKRIVAQKTTLETMQRQSLQIKALQKQKKPITKVKGSPQRLIENSLQTWRLKPQLERMQSQGSNGVQLSLKNAKADRVMRFLHELETKNNLSISKLVIDSAKNKAGFADVRLTIQQ